GASDERRYLSAGHVRLGAIVGVLRRVASPGDALLSQGVDGRLVDVAVVIGEEPVPGLDEDRSRAGEVGIGIDRHRLPPFPDSKLEMQMRPSVFGIAGIADETYLLSGRDRETETAPILRAAGRNPGIDDVIGDTESQTVVGPFRVVVEMEVARLPPAMVDDQPLMSPWDGGTIRVQTPDGSHEPVSDGDHRGQLGGH